MRIQKAIGRHLAEQARKNLKKGILIIAVSYAFLLITGLDYLPIYINLGGLAPAGHFLVGVVFMYGLMQFIVPYQYLKSGLNGERKVISNISNKLGYEHSLFNDVLLKDGKRGNIDHIIIGPRGIFALETKNTEKAVTLNGDNWIGLGSSPSLQAKSHAKRIWNLLDSFNIFEGQTPHVQAVVVLSNRKMQVEIKREPEYCKIIHLKDQADNSLYDYIMEHDFVFTTEKIERIVEILNDKIV